jgi:hypothetical protein
MFATKLYLLALARAVAGTSLSLLLFSSLIEKRNMLDDNVCRNNHDIDASISLQ